MRPIRPLLVLSTCLQACSGDDEPAKKSFADFQTEVAASVGADAVDCGSVDSGEDSIFLCD